ncbi:MAG: hypothetical protein ACRDA8_13040 [Shewanella sp.]
MYSLVASAGTTSPSTPKVVGFKPWFDIGKDSKGITPFVMGSFEAGGTLNLQYTHLNYNHEFKYPEDVKKRKISWRLDGREVSNNKKSFVLPNDSIGKHLELVAIPFSEKGDPIEGKQLVITDFSLTMATGGTQDGKVPISKIAPQISQLKLEGDYQAGGLMKATYVYDANGGRIEGKTRYQWGEKGTTAKLDNYKELISGGVGVEPYQVKRSDIGKVIEVSVKPVNQNGVMGNTYTTDLTKAVPDNAPQMVTITVNPESNVEEHGYAGHPIVKKSKLTAKLTFPIKPRDVVYSELPAFYYYVWKVDGKVAAQGNGKNTFVGEVNMQNKSVVVDVVPGTTLTD